MSILPREPLIWSLEQLVRARLGAVCAWATPSVYSRVEGVLPYRVTVPFTGAGVAPESVVVVGGGSLIDEAKVWVRDNAPGARLIAVPSIWGSGAEATPIAVLNRHGRKHVTVDDSFLPYARVLWPELGSTVPASRALHACGDSWAHALEAFLSPLASAATRAEMALLLRELPAMPLGFDPRWFDLSYRAGAGQARASVGLVHGIAHTLEGALREQQPDGGWSHARLCATFLWPVMELTRSTSDKWETLVRRYTLDGDAVMSVLRRLFDPHAYRRALPVLTSMWPDVLRDPCTRTGGILARQSHLRHFEEFERVAPAQMERPR